MTVGNDDFTKVFTSKSLSYFSQLASNLSYTKTARSLGITQPALTQQIKKIERNVGTPLFYSMGKQIHLTDAGRILLEAVQNVYGTMIKAIDNIQKSTLSSTGSIKIGLLSTIEDSVIEDFIIRYNDLQPDVVLETLLLTRHELWNYLENNQLDLAIMYLPDDSIKNWKPYISQKIMDENLILVNNNPKWSDQRTLHLKEITDQPWVGYPDNYYLTEFLSEQLKNQLVDGPHCVARFAAPDQILKFTREKDVYALFPKSYVLANESQITSQKNLIDASVSFDLNFVYRKEKANIPRISTFLKAWNNYLSDISYEDRLKGFSKS
ncbi:LysR family transcriptional regulator [Bombilactobacillus folatiphilus]|uniref:LysR family transcriptional regulator n=1 Tax=Bombilactobacillus folatiphilus TaxID=2923362 RepID=A0ABY4P769_9LACO|nr:LysR family transcriptional regulator [Bombilactobacillus folatiphilus]UQS81488.1 LysR family transcriptional regulator [Bombilactobacillus folatiphilus]